MSKQNRPAGLKAYEWIRQAADHYESNSIGHGNVNAISAFLANVIKSMHKYMWYRFFRIIDNNGSTENGQLDKHARSRQELHALDPILRTRSPPYFV